MRKLKKKFLQESACEGDQRWGVYIRKGLVNQDYIFPYKGIVVETFETDAGEALKIQDLY